MKSKLALILTTLALSLSAYADPRSPADFAQRAAREAADRGNANNQIAIVHSGDSCCQSSAQTKAKSQQGECCSKH